MSPRAERVLQKRRCRFCRILGFFIFYMFMTGGVGFTLVFLAPAFLPIVGGCSEFSSEILSCVILFYINYTIRPSAATLIVILLISLSLSTNNTLFFLNIVSTSIVSLRASHRFLSPLRAAPHRLIHTCSPSQTHSARGHLCMFLSAPLAEPKAMANTHCALTVALLHDNSSETPSFSQFMKL